MIEAPRDGHLGEALAQEVQVHLPGKLTLAPLTLPLMTEVTMMIEAKGKGQLDQGELHQQDDIQLKMLTLTMKTSWTHQHLVNASLAAPRPLLPDPRGRGMTPTMRMRLTMTLQPHVELVDQVGQTQRLLGGVDQDSQELLESHQAREGLVWDLVQGQTKIMMTPTQEQVKR